MLSLRLLSLESAVLLFGRGCIAVSVSCEALAVSLHITVYHICAYLSSIIWSSYVHSKSKGCSISLHPFQMIGFHAVPFNSVFFCPPFPCSPVHLDSVPGCPDPFRLCLFPQIASKLKYNVSMRVFVSSWHSSSFPAS